MAAEGPVLDCLCVSVKYLWIAQCLTFTGKQVGLNVMIMNYFKRYLRRCTYSCLRPLPGHQNPAVAASPAPGTWPAAPLVDAAEHCGLTLVIYTTKSCVCVTITGTDDLSARLCVCHIHIFRVMACLACHNSKTTCNFEGPSGSACVRCQRIGLCCISHAGPRVHACPRVPKSEHSKKRAHPLFGPFWAPTSDAVGWPLPMSAVMMSSVNCTLIKF